MASNATPDSPDLAAADAAAENLLRNSRAGSIPNIDPARESALDDAFSAVTGTTAPEGELGRDNGGVPVPLPGAPEADPVQKPEPKPDPVQKTDPKPDPAPKPDVKPAASTTRKGLLDDVIDEPAPEPENKPEKAYDDIKLRSDASPKTQETFDAVKARAVERENVVREELNRAIAAKQELEAKLADVEKKVGAVPEQ